MTSSSDKRPNYSRRLIWLLVAVVVAIAGYTGAWFYGADYIVRQVNAGIADANRDGRRANCENPQVRGYPFRLGVFCQSVLFEDARAGIGVRARAFRSAAQVYAPWHVLAELDGPATIQVPGINAIDVAWSTLRSSVRLADPWPERVSVEGTQVRVALDEPGDATAALGRAVHAELHLRPAGQDVEAAARFTDLEVERWLLAGGYLPPVSGVVDVVVRDGLVRGAAFETLRGRSATVRAAQVDFGDDAGVTMRGPVAIDEAGLVDAELEVVLRNPRALADVLGDAMPEIRQQLDIGLSALGSAGDATTLPLRIVKGDVRLGFLPLGSIPPL